MRGATNPNSLVGVARGNLGGATAAVTKAPNTPDGGGEDGNVSMSEARPPFSCPLASLMVIKHSGRQEAVL